MTSYATANDSAAATAAAATTSNITTNNSTSYPATLAAAETTAGVISPPPTPKSPTTPTTSTTTLNSKMQEQFSSPFCYNFRNSNLNTLPNGADYGDFDCDSSLSDGREKADTTPENIKKIDDVIEQRSAIGAVSAADALSTTASNPVYTGSGSHIHSRHNMGLAAAIDDSNAKFCFVTKPPSPRREKDTLGKCERIESNSSVTPDSNKSSSCSSSSKNFNTTNESEIKAADSSAPLDDDDDSLTSNATNTTNTTTTTTTAAKQSYAFTIDNFGDKECDPATAAAKYKSMMERFQNRHRRGASMSKLESEGVVKEPLTLTSSASATPLTQRNARNASRSGAAETEATDATVSKVKLRARDRSTSRVRDASKRHSWSPRSSGAQELTTSQQQQQQQVVATKTAAQTQKPLPPTNNAATRRSTSKSKAPPPPLQLPKGTANLVANRTQFTPRSTAMQMALREVDFLCPQPPLMDIKHLIDMDNVSETGTYTLDGDNYTEEQKDLMNIDKSGRKQQRPKHLHLSDSGAVLNASIRSAQLNSRGSNVLEVNYYHETPLSTTEESPQSPPPQQAAVRLQSTATSGDYILGSHQSAGAYLEKIKSRVLRNMSTKNATSVPELVDLSATKKQAPTGADGADDVGCFTSVTTSGVLAKQSALDPRPKLTRRSSLSTSQIDSSEYVSNEAKLKTATAAVYAAGGFTDHQKAEYRLNLFTNQKDKKFATTRNLIESPPETPRSDAAVLKTAQTKNDWIQEWARNARARSLASESGKNRQSKNQHDPHDLMTRSYTCSSDTGGGESLTDDSIYSKQCAAAKLNKTLFRLAAAAAGECEYASSDPALCTSYAKAQHADSVCKPPKSPSKIPSPLHSLGRARSASRTRASLQNMLSQDEEDVYLQKTAAAINNLQQSFSRKSSIKSPTHSASPRARVPPADAAECSPQHSIESPNRHHRRQVSASHDAASYAVRAAHAQQQLQLMTSSINEQQLQLLTSGEYLAKQMRMRKNSFDGGNVNGDSPARRSDKYSGAGVTNATENDPLLSPLRRSSSFSAKIAAASQRVARPNFQNIYTPPAARHNYALAAAVSPAIKKSASSNNFRREIYSDYDDNLQYYINDEDDLGGDAYYSSGAEEDEDMGHAGGYYQTAPADVTGVAAAPLTNTRYNKALLMRIERSKQKVAVSKPNSAPASKVSANAAANAAGLVACPNTPEQPRRAIKSATSALRGGNARQSMPRDVSLSRLAQQVPNSLASAKKQLLQTAAAVPVAAAKASASSQRVQPKYLDISKYKPVQGNSFLRKNDAKSTLKAPVADAVTAMKRSPSSSSMGLSRADPTRTSNRSVRSVASCMTTSGTSLGGGTGRASSAVRRDLSISKQKEAEMAMWKRRSTYDPMRAAAEDRRKKEEAKRVALAKSFGEGSCERPSRSPYRRGQL